MSHEKLLSELIETKSYSGEEKDIRNLIDGWFKKRGIESFVQGENLIVHFEGKDTNRAFIFNSHMDTVSSGDKPWKYGAWTPTVEGKKMIGLGASDMKSGLAASMLLLEEIHSKGIPPVDMWFTYVVNEEVDGSGTESFASWFADQGYTKKYKDIAAIFTEPTGLIKVEHGHRGNLFVRVTAQGESGHSSRPHEIKSVLAVRKIIKFADALQAQVKKWQKEYKNPNFKKTITVGEFTAIYAGVKVKDGKIVTASPNKFPSECIATFDLRTVSGFHEIAEKKLVALGREMDVKVSMEYPPAPAGFTDPKEKIVQLTKTVGGNRKLATSLGSTDLGFLTTKGIKGVILGPGEDDQSHKLNEYCYPAQIPQAVEIYKQIVETWAK